MCATLSSPKKSWEKYVDDWGSAWSTRYRTRLSPLQSRNGTTTVRSRPAYLRR